MILKSLAVLDWIRHNLTQVGDDASQALYQLSRSETSRVDWMERISGSSATNNNGGGEEDDDRLNTNTIQISGESLPLPSDGEASFAICHIANFVELTLGNSYPALTGYEEQIAIALAAHHLNTGDGSIVREVQDLHKRCDVRFTIEIKDNQLDRATAVTNALEYLERSPLSLEGQKPCAFLGARASETTIPTAMLTSIQGYLHLAPSVFASELEDEHQYPLFARTSPTEYGGSVALVQLMKLWEVKHLAVINVNDAFGNQLVDTMRLAITNTYPDLELQQFPLDQQATGEQNSQAISQVVSGLKKSLYRYVYVAIHNKDNLGHDALMEEALRQNVIQDYAWFFSPSVFDIFRDRYFPEDSNLAKAYSNVGQVSITPFLPNADPERKLPADHFLEALGELRNAQDLEYLNSKFPHGDHVNSTLYKSMTLPVQNGEIFEEMTTLNFTTRSEGFYYDAAIAVGLATCDAIANNGKDFTGQDHFNALTARSFQGVTGTIQFDPVTGTRDPSTVIYSNLNRVPRYINDTHFALEIVNTHRFTNGQWNAIGDTEFIFNSGQSTIPLDLPPVTVQDNRIGPAVRGIVLTLCASSILLSILMSVWAARHSFTHVVRASQPFFLHSVTIGTLVFAAAIIPMVMDQGIAFMDEYGNTVACNATIWLVSIGFCVTFSALGSKNFRINKLLTSSKSMKRINVTLLDVAIPMICLVSVNTIVLAVMTALAPIQFGTEVLQEDIFGRPTETLSRCQFENAQLPYIIVLVVINLGCLLIAIFQAYQARHLSTEFGESKYLFLSFVLSLLVVLIGVPVLILARDNNTSAAVFIAGAMIVTITVSILLFMFLPKVTYLRRHGNKLDRFRLAISSIAAKAAKSSTSIRNDTAERFQVGGTYVSGMFESDISSSLTPKSSRTTAFGSIQVLNAQPKEELILRNEELQIEIARLRRRVTFLTMPGPPNATRSAANTTNVQLEESSGVADETRDMVHDHQ